MIKVMAFGTFDYFHPGHKSFLKQAKKLGGFLIIVVARDENVKKAKSLFPKNGERSRLKAVKAAKIADKVVLGSKTHNFYRTIRTHKPEIITLGYDQKPQLVSLKKDLKRHRLGNVKLIRLRPYRPDIYKSSKISKEKFV